MENKSTDFFKSRLGEIEVLLQERKSSICIRECGSVFEIGLRQLLQNYLQDCEDFAKRDEVLAAERSIAKGNESLKKFGLGQLIGLYVEGKVFDKLKGHLKLPMAKLRRISWNDVVSLRNAATHDDDNASFSAEDALQMYFWLRIFLSESGLSGSMASSSLLLGSAFDSTCPSCKDGLQKGWKFCPACGTCVRMECSGCGEHLAPKFKICPYCETPVRGTTPDSIQARHAYDTLFRGAFLDKYVNEHERHLLEQKRLELGLSIEEAADIERACVPPGEAMYMHLVEGLCLNGNITEIGRAYLNKKRIELKIDSHSAKLIERGVLRTVKEASKLGSDQSGGHTQS